jgi:cholesterol transport system auxiliary component
MTKNDRRPGPDTKYLDRRVFLIASSSLVLAACGSLDKLIGPPDAPQIYALRPAMPSAQPGEKVLWALAIQKPDASNNLDSARIALARGNTQLDYYANATWPDRLPDMVQTALLAGFEATGRIDAVARDEDALHSDYELSTDLRDFEARYATSDGVPNVAITIIAHMADTKSRKMVANLAVSLTEPASANSVDAVVQALDTVLAKAIVQITQWALALPPPSSIAADAAEPAPEAAPRPSLRGGRADKAVPPTGPGANEIPVPGSASRPAP